MEQENKVEEVNDKIVEETKPENDDKIDNKIAEGKSGEDSEWENILGSGALMKKILVKGKPDQRPQRSDICTINYKCMLEDGTVVDEMLGYSLQLGDLESVQAIDLALAIMGVGEKSLLKVAPKLGYGALGLKPSVPPNANLLIEVELINFEPEEDMETLSIAQRKKIGNVKRARGNFWYNRDENTFAIQCYRRALDYLDEVEGGIPSDFATKNYEASDAELQSLLEDRVNVSNNIAAAQMKIGALDAALQSLQNVLRCQPNNVKALYRKAKILRDKNDLIEALKCLNKARALDPDNSTIQKEISELTGIQKKHKDQEKELAKRMFNAKTQDDKDFKKTDKQSSSVLYATMVGVVAVCVAGVAAWRIKYYS